MATNVTGQAVVFNHKTSLTNALNSTSKNTIYFTPDGHIVLDNLDYTPDYQPLINEENKLSYSLISGLGTAAGKGFTDTFYNNSVDDVYANHLPTCAAVRAYVGETAMICKEATGEIDLHDAVTNDIAKFGDMFVAKYDFEMTDGTSVKTGDLLVCVPVKIPPQGSQERWGKKWIVINGGTSSGGGESGGGGLYWD